MPTLVAVSSPPAPAPSIPAAEAADDAAAINATHPFPTSEGINMTTLLMGSTLITDPKLHAEATRAMQNGTALSFAAARVAAGLVKSGMNAKDAVSHAAQSQLQRRQDPVTLVADFVDMFLVLASTEAGFEFTRMVLEIDKLFTGREDEWGLSP
ncbi:hypothetical protein SBRCBS47491_006965 [Sporothrix bragantina]|uniref:Uncharacterized protein n=1 Tax=Sporothrix bragantina TaxID=671064 RepID=A0ABP0CBJ8_9PEZI